MGSRTRYNTKTALAADYWYSKKLQWRDGMGYQLGLSYIFDSRYKLVVVLRAGSKDAS